MTVATLNKPNSEPSDNFLNLDPIPIHDPARQIGSVPTLAMGAASGLIAQTVPHPDGLGLGLGSGTSCAIQCLSILLPLPLMSARPDRTNSILVET